MPCICACMSDLCPGVYSEEQRDLHSMDHSTFIHTDEQLLPLCACTCMHASMHAYQCCCLRNDCKVHIMSYACIDTCIALEAFPGSITI